MKNEIGKKSKSSITGDSNESEKAMVTLHELMAKKKQEVKGSTTTGQQSIEHKKEQ